MEHICDSRDAAQAVLLALENEAVLGHTFNIAGPEPFLYTEIAPRLASLLGARSVEGRCRKIHSYSLSLTRARTALQYLPRFGVMESLEDALKTH